MLFWHLCRVGGRIHCKQAAVSAVRPRPAEGPAGHTAVAAPPTGTKALRGALVFYLFTLRPPDAHFDVQGYRNSSMCLN